jgi:hypothetical protein
MVVEQKAAIGRAHKHQTVSPGPEGSSDGAGTDITFDRTSCERRAATVSSPDATIRGTEDPQPDPTETAHHHPPSGGVVDVRIASPSNHGRTPTF